MAEYTSYQDYYKRTPYKSAGAIRAEKEAASKKRMTKVWNKAAKSTEAGASYDMKGGGYGKRLRQMAQKKTGDTDPARLLSRKASAEAGFYKTAGRAWKGNEWMRKALDEAWEKDTGHYRTAHTQQVHSKSLWRGGDDQFASEAEKSARTPSLYSSFSETGYNQFGHLMAARAQQIHSDHIRGEESAKRMGERKARGGMGARGSTIMTGGHRGILEEAKTKKTTLIGA